MTHTVIAYDLGTGGVKATLIDQTLNILSEAFEAYPTYYSPDGRHEQNPADWWEAIIRATAKLQAGAPQSEVCAISISGHSLGIVSVDQAGNLLADRTPIWSDSRASAEAELFFKEMDYNEWYLSTGAGNPAAIYPIFKIMHCKAHTPELYRDTAVFLGTKDYINLKLSGKAVTDRSYASGSGLFDLKQNIYRSDYISAAAIDPDKLPQVLASTDTVGYLTQEAATRLELPAGIPIIAGGVDNSCMALGAGCCREGDMYASLGSSAWMAIASHDTMVNLKTKPYLFAHVIPNMFLPHGGCFSSGSSHRWAINTIFHLPEEQKYSEFEQLATQSPRGARGILFAPTMAGGSSTDPAATIRGAYANLDLSHTPADLALATLEGIAMHLAYTKDALLAERPHPNRLLLVGGGAKSAFWRQIYADVFDTLIVKTSVMQNAAALGAAVVGMIGCGMQSDFNCVDHAHKDADISTPIPEHSALYRRLRPAFAELLHSQAAIYALSQQV